MNTHVSKCKNDKIKKATIFSTVQVFGTFVKYQMAVAVWAYFWNFYPIDLLVYK
jgi:hypothetical protein